MTHIELLEARMAALDKFAIFAETDPQGKITYANDRFCEISKYSREELIGQDHRIVNSGYHPKSFFKEMWATIGGGKIWRGEVRNKAKDGSFYWVNTTIVPLMNRQDKPEKYLVLRIVTTELKATEEKLKKMNNAIPGLVYEFALDTKGQMRCLYLSEFCKPLLGLEVQAVLEDFSLIWSRILPEDLEGLTQSIYVSAAELKPWSYEFRIKDTHGNLKYIQGNSIPEKPDADGTMRWYGVMIDISARKILEQQFLHAQKMEAIGSLAGGVAHDFNNLLTVINGYSEMIAAKLKTDDPTLTKIEEIRKAGNRAAALTAQLLAFSRRQTVQVEIVNMNEQIADMEKMIHRLIAEKIQVVISREKDLWLIKMDPHQLQQILMNLVINARDAIEGSGTIAIETQNKDLREDHVSEFATIPAGKYAVVSVSDTGCGMSEEVQKHIFEPFFTTKEKGKGTGLGLATCYGIARQAQGYFDVQSIVGKGSSFRVWFPITEEKAKSHSAGQSGTDLPVGKETVLIVEDESGLRKFVSNLLQDLGYQVHEAENGQDALNRLQSGSLKNVDIILTDVMMPHMDGKELVNQVIQLYPEIKIIMMSGYTGADTEKVMDADIPFLQKPFSLKQLALKMREVLDA